MWMWTITSATGTKRLKEWATTPTEITKPSVWTSTGWSTTPLQPMKKISALLISISKRPTQGRRNILAVGMEESVRDAKLLTISINWWASTLFKPTEKDLTISICFISRDRLWSNDFHKLFNLIITKWRDEAIRTGASLITGAGIDLSIGKIIQKFEVDIDGLEMYLFIGNLRVIDPLCRMALQELFEVDAYSRIWYQSMHQYVVVFIFTFSLDLLEIFHRHRPFLRLIGHRLHMIDEGLTEVFRYIFGISFDEVPPIFRGFKEQA